MRTKPLSRRPRRTTTPLSVEQMEGRCLLASFAVTDLGTLGGGSTAYAYDINEAGQVVEVLELAAAALRHGAGDQVATAS